MRAALIRVREGLPEVQVVDGSLLVAHEDVEGEEIERRNSLTTKHLEQVWEAVAVEIHHHV
jgi:uncharacterized protein